MSKFKKVVFISVGALVAFCFLLLGVVCCAVGIYKVENQAEAATGTPSDPISGDIIQLLDIPLVPDLNADGWTLRGSFVTRGNTGYCTTYSNVTYRLIYKISCNIISGHRYLFTMQGVIPSSSVNLYYGSNVSSAMTPFTISSNFFSAIWTPSADYDFFSFELERYANFDSEMSFRGVQLIDLTACNCTRSTFSYSSFFVTFGSSFVPYTSGMPVSEYFKHLGYNYDYGTGYSAGYRSGFSDGLTAFTDGSAVFTCDSSNFVSPTPLWENVVGNYYTVNGRTEGPEPLILNVGYLDIFQLNFSDILNSFPSFSWNLPTASVVDGVLSYSTNSYYSTYFGYDTGDYNRLYFSDSTSSSDPWQNYHIYMLMTDHTTEIYVDFFLSSSQSSSPVPNFNSSFGIDIYALSFSLTSQSSEFYSNGYNDGIDHANSTLNTSSVSYTTGYNRGFADAENPITFTNLMTSVLDVPLKTFNGLFNFDFLGINLKAFLLSLFTLGLIVAIIRLCLGGKS